MAIRVARNNALEVSPFHLIAISSLEPDYKIAFAINKKLNIQLSNSHSEENTDFQLPIHNLFKFTDSEEEIKYIFAKNRFEASYLIPELKNVDYFFIVQPENERILPEISIFIKKLRGITNILGVLKVHTYKIKSVKKFIR